MRKFQRFRKEQKQRGVTHLGCLGIGSGWVPLVQIDPTVTPPFSDVEKPKQPGIFRLEPLDFRLAKGCYGTVCDLPVACNSHLCVLACHSMLGSGCIQADGSRRELVVPPRFDGRTPPSTQVQCDLGLLFENLRSSLPRRLSAVDSLGSSLRTGLRAWASWEALSP